VAVGETIPVSAALADRALNAEALVSVEREFWNAPTLLPSLPSAVSLALKAAVFLS
jgi:hypothetical protein